MKEVRDLSLQYFLLNHPGDNVFYFAFHYLKGYEFKSCLRKRLISGNPCPFHWQMVGIYIYVFSNDMTKLSLSARMPPTLTFVKFKHDFTVNKRWRWYASISWKGIRNLNFNGIVWRDFSASVTDHDVISVLKKTYSNVRSIDLSYQRSLTDKLPRHLC